jgi:hypothetical protein
MHKRFIAVSTAVAALALVLSFSTSSARADSIHSRDLKIDTFTPFANSCDLECVLDSVFTADRDDRSPLFSDKHDDFAGSPQFAWDAWANLLSGPFGFPDGSHRVRRDDRDRGRDGDATAVPEPGSLLLASFGLMGLFLLRKTRHRNPPFPPAAV